MLPQWVLGVFFSATATAFAALGDNLVKKSFNMLEAAGLDRKDRWKCNNDGRFWWVNVAFVSGWCTNMLLNAALNLAALAFAPASIVMPFAALHIVFAVWFAR